jgi:seryl-tRNA synthetase
MSTNDNELIKLKNKLEQLINKKNTLESTLNEKKNKLDSLITIFANINKNTSRLRQLMENQNVSSQTSLTTAQSSGVNNTVQVTPTGPSKSTVQHGTVPNNNDRVTPRASSESTGQPGTVQNNTVGDSTTGSSVSRRRRRFYKNPLRLENLLNLIESKKVNDSITQRAVSKKKHRGKRKSKMRSKSRKK